MKKIIVIVISLPLLCGCISMPTMKALMEEIIIPEILQDAFIIAAVGAYHEKEKTWPKSIADLRDFLDKTNFPEKEKPKIDWDRYSSAKFNILPNGNLEIEYEYKSKLTKAFNYNMKIGPTKSHYKTETKSSRIIATVSEEQGTNKRKIIIELSENKCGICKGEITKIADPEIKEDITVKIRELFQNQKIEIEQIESLDDLRIFHNYKLLRIFVHPWVLEHVSLPDGPSYGMFAYNKEKLLYLNHDNNNLANILWEEKFISAKDFKPQTVAEVLILCQIPERQVFSDLVNSIQDVLDYEKGKDSIEGYVVDKEKLRKYKDTIVPPHWEDKEKTEDLVFFVLSGWMHKTKNLIRIIATFDKYSPSLTIRKEILEDNIFKEIPDIKY